MNVLVGQYPIFTVKLWITQPCHLVKIKIIIHVYTYHIFRSSDCYGPHSVSATQRSKRTAATPPHTTSVVVSSTRCCIAVDVSQNRWCDGNTVTRLPKLQGSSSYIYQWPHCLTCFFALINVSPIIFKISISQHNLNKFSTMVHYKIIIIILFVYLR